MADTGFKFCARCGCRHAPPTGKRKCKRPLDDMTVLPLVLEQPTSTPHVVPPARSTDDRIDTLVGVVTDLVSRVDTASAQQPTVDAFHIFACR
jgi:hypothetical protein